MNRKVVYGLLAFPFVLLVAVLAFMPGETRSTFLTEFQHRTRLMMGYEAKTYSEEKGLRSEHPEEYGQAHAEETADSDEAEVTEDSTEEEPDAQVPSEEATSDGAVGEVAADESDS